MSWICFIVAVSLVCAADEQRTTSRNCVKLQTIRDGMSLVNMQLEALRDDVTQQHVNLEDERRELSAHESQTAALLESIERNQSQYQSDLISLLNSFQILVSRPKNCKEVQALGREVTGVYLIYPHGDDVSLSVFCDMDTEGGGWTVFQRRQDGSVSFKREWAEYRNGFGNLRGEHWLGNEHIHVMTASSAHEMRVELGSWENERVYARYERFAVGSETDGYRLTVGNYSGTAGGDSLGGIDHRDYQNGAKFSTRLRDNDHFPNFNCAQEYQSGFWFKKCFRASLNHPYVSRSSTRAWHGIIWSTYKGESYSLKFTELKMRPL